MGIGVGVGGLGGTHNGCVFCYDVCPYEPSGEVLVPETATHRRSDSLSRLAGFPVTDRADHGRWFPTRTRWGPCVGPDREGGLHVSAWSVSPFLGLDSTLNLWLDTFAGRRRHPAAKRVWAFASQPL